MALMVAARFFHLNFLLQDTKETISHVPSYKYNPAHGFKIREPEKHVLKCRVYVMAVVINAGYKFFYTGSEIFRSDLSMHWRLFLNLETQTVCTETWNNCLEFQNVIITLLRWVCYLLLSVVSMLSEVSNNI
jgi:hypothetical protein